MTQPFNKSTRAPFEAGEVPAAGWFAIEPVCAWQPREQEELRRALGLPEEGPPVEARLDAAALAELADDFARRGDPAGLPVSKNHDFEAAAGWIKALQVEADRLWAWIEWTPEGHRAINNREYVYFSTEYDYGDFELVDGVAVPRRLAGLSVTNYPNHAEGQIPMTNNKTRTRTHGRARLIYNAKNLTMKPRDKNETPAAKADDPKPAPAPVDTPAPTDDGKPEDTNADPPAATDDPTKAADCNADDPALDMILEIADILGLDETADAQAVLDAVKAQAAKIEELTQALASANAATDTNSRRLRYPGLARLRDLNRRLRLTGQTPERDVNIRINGIARQVNCQEKAMVDYCNSRINSEETKLGRNLNQAEYTKVFARAMRDWKDGKR